MSDAEPKRGQPKQEENGGSQAGRGGLALAAGKLYFLVSGLVQQILLKAVLGLGGYGAYSTVSSVASISYNPLVQAGIQGVSREIAATDGESVPFVQRRLLGVHLLVAAVAALMFFAAAGPTARSLGAPHLVVPIRILSALLFLYALYAPLIGYLNGRRRFLGQAGLDAAAATLRTIGLVVGAYAAIHFFPQDTESAATLVRVEGSAVGFCVAGVFILSAALKLTGWGQSGGTRPKTSDYLLVILPILGGQILLNLLFQADALLLRRFASDAAAAASLAPEAADPYVGAYRATQLFCFLPFQLLTSVTFVLFPLLASAQSKGNQAEVSQLVDRGLRIAVIVAGLIVSALVAVPGGLIALVFGAEASELGAGSMRILAVGMGFFALLGVMTSAMNSLGAEGQSFVLIGVAVVGVISLCVFVARTDELNAELLSRVAAATSSAMLLTTGAAAWRLKVISGGTIPLLPLVRTVLAVGAAGYVGSNLFGGGHLMTLVTATVAGLIFLIFLIVTGELKKADWVTITNLVRR